MTVVYEPGEEIELERIHPNRQFFSKALSWRDQKEFRKESSAIKELEDETEQVDAALKMLSERITRCEPAMEVTPESIAAVLDFRQIWQLFTAIGYNLTDEEKKT